MTMLRHQEILPAHEATWKRIFPISSQAYLNLVSCQIMHSKIRAKQQILTTKINIPLTSCLFADVFLLNKLIVENMLPDNEKEIIYVAEDNVNK